jgi:hypothetical protein
MFIVHPEVKLKQPAIYICPKCKSRNGGLVMHGIAKVMLRFDTYHQKITDMELTCRQVTPLIDATAECTECGYKNEASQFMVPEVKNVNS